MELKEEKEAALKKVQEVTLSIHSLKQQDDFLITNIRRLKKEQAELRQEYLAAVRKNLRAQLNNIDIQEKDGSIVNLGEKYGRKKGN